MDFIRYLICYLFGHVPGPISCVREGSGTVHRFTCHRCGNDVLEVNGDQFVI